MQDFLTFATISLPGHRVTRDTPDPLSLCNAGGQRVNTDTCPDEL